MKAIPTTLTVMKVGPGVLNLMKGTTNRMPSTLQGLLLAITLTIRCHAADAQTIEGESLKPLQLSGVSRMQDMNQFGAGAWSGNAQLWWTGGKPGDRLALEIPVPADGEYLIGAGFTKAGDYGIFEFSIDGNKLGAPLDFFDKRVVHTGTIALGGTVKLAAGTRKLEVKISGANPAAKKGYMLGLDYLVIAAGGKADVTSLGPKLLVAGSAQSSGLKEGNADDAEPKSAARQQALFTVPEGFEIELVAGEEQGLPKPVMTQFDNAGRMWSVTATAYPCDNDPEIWRKPGMDRVVVIDHPTVRGPRTVRTFADGMVMPLSVLPSGNGAYVAQGPEILFLEDTDGDGSADTRKVLLSGFGIQDTHTLPHQLNRMPGGRIVYSQGVLNSGRVTDAGGQRVDFNKTLVATFRPDGTGHEIIGAGMNNIWAWSVSREGQVFIHEANDLGYSIVPFEEDSSYPSFVKTKIHPDAPFHPPTAEGLKLGGTGFSGLALCDDRAGSFPAPWHGLMFVANPITGRINSVAMERGAGGVFRFTKKDDLVSCGDRMFRPVAITFGPDGCLYITDWYNRIISHNEVARDHPARDRSRGRVWRLRHKSQPERVIPDMTKVPAAQLPRHLAADSTWEMRAAWREIASRGGKSLIPELTALIRERSSGDDVRIHALWALEDLGHFDATVWAGLLASENPNVRREAVRAMSSLKVPASEAFVLLQKLAEEPAWTVRYEVLRFFRRTPGVVDPAQITWLARWSVGPAGTAAVKEKSGPYLALGGAYERVFQDFLFQLVKEKGTRRMISDDSKYDAVTATQPARSAAETGATKVRAAAVKKLVTKPGDRPADEGKQLVESLCLACHQISGKGIALAPPLDGSASRDVDALITAILDPDAAVENVFRLYRVETIDGGKSEGFRKSVDAKEITLMFMGGITHTIPTDTVKTAGYVQGKSTMPPLGFGLNDQQVADIIRHLRSVE